jgi:hypothetical protein
LKILETLFGLMNQQVLIARVGCDFVVYTSIKYSI